MAVSITLCDKSEAMVKAWRNYFADDTGIKAICQNILTVGTDAVVVPANAFGFTDGGVDVLVSGAIFDMGLQDTLRPLIAREYGGELLVGQAVIMATTNQRIRHIVVAPTMRIPEDVGNTVNAYLAMRGALIAIEQHNRANTAPNRINSVAVPGLATGVGNMPFERSAYQMWIAYRTVMLGDVEWAQTLVKQSAIHKKMRDR
jgi:O-acetyl-ADP-ribose deacetylase (regulator of RNase III)